MPTLNKPKRKTSNKNPIIKGIYNNTNWVKLRKAYLMEHPLCENCLKQGLTEVAVEVHHLTPISKGQDVLAMKDLAYNYNNLMSLCSKCHHDIHNKMRNDR